MNRAKLKTYAPQARRDFIQAVTDRAAFYGLTAKNIEPITEQGDVAIIAGKAFPRAIVRKRKALEDRITRQGFEQTMEAMAYTWFNRFVAIRFMELHVYLDHGYRVLSHPEGKATPEILEHAEHVELPGLDKNTVVDLKLDASKEAELYRLLLIAQCNALHAAMPFLFEQIDDETELLLPDNLLHSDSLIRKQVNEIDEEDWQEVEIIGWLYQFYISEKKGQVIGRVVKSEDIPAATQLFTPNWIVKYLVQNSLGRQWLATYPTSSLRQQMEYYIEPAEQTPEAQAQLKAITPESLNPEELTLLDPACGSGHILVEAYDLFKTIYQERGYRVRDIPTLILRKNLFGLEIDDRAAQLAAFALMMKARADDRRIFASSIQPNVISIQESKGLNAKSLSDALNVPLVQGERAGEKGNISPADISDLINLFEHGKTFGSLIQVPPALAEKLPAIGHRVRDVLAHGDLMTQPAAKVLLPLIEQAWMLGRQYDCVVANPPYMDSKYFPSSLKILLDKFPKDYRNNLFSTFIHQGLLLVRPNGYFALVTPFVWLFIASYKSVRLDILNNRTVITMTKPSYTAFFDTATVQFVLFVLQSCRLNLIGDYFDLGYLGSADSQSLRLKEYIQIPNHSSHYRLSSQEFLKMPGAELAFWLSKPAREAFERGVPLGTIAEPRQGMATGDNSRFVRAWQEVSLQNIGLKISSRDEAINSGLKWFPYNKGGDFRKWYGNNDFVVNWENDGSEIKNFVDKSGKLRSRPQNLDFFFQPSLTWSFISSYSFGIRVCEAGHLFDVGGSSAFPGSDQIYTLAAFLCSKISTLLMQGLNPTVNMQVGNVAALPILRKELVERRQELDQLVKEAVEIARNDWNSIERSWEFQNFPLLEYSPASGLISDAFSRLELVNRTQIERMQQLEQVINQLLITIYGLQDEILSEVSEDQITLYRVTREDVTKRLISYIIGCSLGRYSLEKPGLIYAFGGNKLFDSSHYTKFTADDDGIISVTEIEWFSDDAVNRVRDFVQVVWSQETLAANLKFIAESLNPQKEEQPLDTIRRYMARSFYRDHLRYYKAGSKSPPRPIYWLFSSGEQRAFQCLVYLHRYNEGTLSRMRTEYVIPLQGKIAARIEHLANDAQQATSTSHRKKLEKEQDALHKQQAELLAFDEKLRHHADMRITLDLDDGVKVNYGKFGDLLAEVKAVCGREED